MTTPQSSNKSISYVSLNRQYRKLKREWMNKASRDDLANMLVLVASNHELPEQLKNIVKILAVNSLTEQLVKLEKNSHGKVPSRRTRPVNPDTVDDTFTG